MRPVAWVAGLVLLLSLQCAGVATGATLEKVGEFDQPIFVTSDPSNPSDLFVVEREGIVMQLSGGNATQFADLTPLVSCCFGERGLLSIALAPDFDASGRFYAAYTGTVAAGGDEGDIHVDAFRPGGSGEDELVREPILTIGHSELPQHHGGQLQFGPDGYLYLSTGDGGGIGDPLENGQNLETLLGKILRIDPRPGQEPPYVIPPGNPFAAGPGRDEIWSYGLRNPWRFSFDRANGDMVIGDVGQGEHEEIDYAPRTLAGEVGGAGVNYGWNCREGLFPYPSAPSSCTGMSGFTGPAFDYPHDDPGNGAAHGCAVTGGYVVRDPGLPDLYGRYVYADFCEGGIRSMALPGANGAPATGDRSEGLVVANPTSFGEDSGGRIYVVSNKGAVYRLAPGSPKQAPGAPSGASATSRSRTAKGVRLLLRVTRRLPENRVEILVRAKPCLDSMGRLVLLKRGGRRFAVKRLDNRCATHFKLTVGHRSTFRALLPASGYRSQVLTIALAKPRP